MLVFHRVLCPDQLCFHFLFCLTFIRNINMQTTPCCLLQNQRFAEADSCRGSVRFYSPVSEASDSGAAVGVGGSYCSV